MYYTLRGKVLAGIKFRDFATICTVCENQSTLIFLILLFVKIISHVNPHVSVSYKYMLIMCYVCYIFRIYINTFEFVFLKQSLLNLYSSPIIRFLISVSLSCLISHPSCHLSLLFITKTVMLSYPWVVLITW